MFCCCCCCHCFSSANPLLINGIWCDLFMHCFLKSTERKKKSIIEIRRMNKTPSNECGRIDEYNKSNKVGWKCVGFWSSSNWQMSIDSVSPFMQQPFVIIVSDFRTILLIHDFFFLSLGSFFLFVFATLATCTHRFLFSPWFGPL